MGSQPQGPAGSAPAAAATARGPMRKAGTIWPQLWKGRTT